VEGATTPCARKAFCMRAARRGRAIPAGKMRQKTMAPAGRVSDHSNKHER
jgi:hypothetical protein